MQLNIKRVTIVTSMVGQDTLLLTTELLDESGAPVVLTQKFQKGHAEEFMRRNYPSIAYQILE